MQLILLLKYWAQITIVILCLLLLFAVSTCSSKEREIKLLISEHQLTLMTNEAANLARISDIERINNERWQDAVNENTRAQKQIADSYASNNAIVDGLSETIDKTSADFITANADAGAKYTAALADISKDCIREITALSRLADGHVADIIMLQKSWPKR